MVTLEFPFDRALAMRALRALLRLHIGRRWIPVALALATGLAVTLSTDAPWARKVGAFALAAGLFTASRWVSVYRSGAAILKRRDREAGDGVVRIVLTDEGVEQVGRNRTLTTPWADVTRSSTTPDFLFLFAGRKAVALIPRAALTPEAEELLERHAGGAPRA